MTDYCRSITFTKSGKTYVIRDEATYQQVQTILGGGAARPLVPVNQGIANAGKFLKVDAQGNVTVETVDIPSVDGLVTSEQLEQAVANLVSSTDLQEAIDAVEAQIPSVEGLASEQYVDEAIAGIDIPEGLDTLTEDVATLKDEVADIFTSTPLVNVDLTTLETTQRKVGCWYDNGSVNPLTTWNYLIIPNKGYKTINTIIFSGNASADNVYCIDYYNSDTVFNKDTLIGGSFANTVAGTRIEGVAEVPAGTKTIIANHRLSNGDIQLLASGAEETGRIADIEEVLYTKADKQIDKVKDGLVIAVVGASTSTKINKDAYELTITEQDIGVPLSAYLTYYDYYGLSGSTPVGLTIGGHTFTADEIGQEISFTPTAQDVGKSLGLALRYSGNDNKKVWWEYLEDLGATVRPVCWSGSSISSHEESVTIRRTAHSWHDAQIRKMGVRIPGSMQRKAPDIVIITRGINDMTHAPYAKLTPNFFDNYDWSYPTTDVVTDGWGILEGLSMWIQKVREAYPFARICIANSRMVKRINCSKFPVNNGLYSIPQLNDALEEAARFFGCNIIDFNVSGVNFENIYPEYSDDSSTIPTHPTQYGHNAMARQVIIDLKSKLDFLNLPHEDRNSKLPMSVKYTLTNVSSTNNATKVALGSSYTTTLSPVGSIIVTVRQNGANITSTAYNATTGVVTINPVDGNIEIEATYSGTSYNVTNTLTNVTNTNTTTSVPESTTYTAELVSNVGYIKDSVVVTMGGADVTSSVYADGFINIPSVTGDITITANATETIGASYQIHNARTGILNGAAPTSFNSTNLSRATMKFITGPSSGLKDGLIVSGIYGDIFCSTYKSGSNYCFGTGASAITSVVVEGNTKYIAELTNINQSKSYLNIYAGDDTELTNLLGTTNRTATQTYPFALDSTYTTSNQSYNTFHRIIENKLYDTNGDLVRCYVPATRTSDSVEGHYDKLTGEFIPLSVDQ